MADNSRATKGGLLTRHRERANQVAPAAKYRSTSLEELGDKLVGLQ